MNIEIKKKIDQAIETYNKYAKIYAEYLDTKLIQFQLHEFMSLLPKGGKILDIGCGAGRDLAYFSEDGFEAIGIDLAKELLKKAKAKKLKVKNMNLLELNFKENTFDGIWCMATLSDIPRSELSNAIKNFNKVLKKEGIIYLAVKEGEGEKVIKKERYGNEPRFYTFYKKGELEQELTKNNFTILKSTVSDDQRYKWVEIFAQKR